MSTDNSESPEVQGRRALARVELGGLVRASRGQPMTARLAATLAHLALKAGTPSAAVAPLLQGLAQTDGAGRVGARKALARLYRRSDALELAREQLQVLLVENPADRRARLTLNALLEREERWDELDVSLDQQTREELLRGAPRRASAAARRRAELWEERLSNSARAALRYGQAAQLAEQGEDFQGGLRLRLLWLRSLHKSQAPARVIAEAVEAALRAGGRIGEVDRVRRLVAQLKLGSAADEQTELDVGVVAAPELPAEGTPVAIPAEGVDALPMPEPTPWMPPPVSKRSGSAAIDPHSAVRRVAVIAFEARRPQLPSSGVGIRIVAGGPAVAAAPPEVRTLRVPQVPVVPPADENWEGSTAGTLDEDEITSGAGGPPTEPSVVALGDPAQALPPSFGLSPAKVSIKERGQLFERVRGAPLEPQGYRLLSEHFDSGSDSSRAGLMLEIARALEGNPQPAPRAPKLILSATDRAGLKHPELRGEEGELLGLSGVALCRIYPTRGAEAGSREEFRLNLGKGAKAAADALLAAVRILGLRAPDVFPNNDNGPPFALVFPGALRLLVGRLAIKHEVPDAELRFFAGRALFTQNPDLLCLRNLKREHLTAALKVLAQVLRGHSQTAEARAVRDGLPPKGLERLRQLNERVGGTMNLANLSDGARHSANRAGLVVCGAVAPALAALRAKKALPSEMIALVRFAASERYLLLRSRALSSSL